MILIIIICENWKKKSCMKQDESFQRFSSQRFKIVFNLHVYWMYKSLLSLVSYTIFYHKRSGYNRFLLLQQLNIYGIRGNFYAGLKAIYYVINKKWWFTNTRQLYALWRSNTPRFSFGAHTPPYELSLCLNSATNIALFAFEVADFLCV